MKFCSDCAGEIQFETPQDDNRKRAVCRQCGTIHYSNPKVIAGCLPVWQDKVLLCKRAIEPRKGYWTLPAGFLENNESIEDGAHRETWEEAEAKVTGSELYTVFSLPHISQIYVFYKGELIDGQYGVGSESLESALFCESEIPWDNLAFPVITDTLKHYFADRTQAASEHKFPVHDGVINFRRRIKQD